MRNYHMHALGRNIGYSALVLIIGAGFVHTSTAHAQVASTTASTTASVSIIDGSYSPKNLTIAPGTTVTWTNNGTVEHTVTADNGSFNSGMLATSSTYSLTFTDPGTYAYYCIPHGAPGGIGMSGTVVVDAALATTTSTTAATSTPTTTATSTTATSTTSTTTSPSTTATSTNITTADLASLQSEIALLKHMVSDLQDQVQILLTAHETHSSIDSYFSEPFSDLHHDSEYWDIDGNTSNDASSNSSDNSY